MALTKSDIPDLLLPGLKAEVAIAYKSEVDDSSAEKIAPAGDRTAEKSATVVNTPLPSQRYAWLGTVPPMREFVDERHPSGMAVYAQTIEDKTFESTIAVDRRAIEDDQLDMIKLRIRDLASRVSAHRQQIVVQALIDGFTNLGYDGVSLFHASHPTAAG